MKVQSIIKYGYACYVITPCSAKLAQYKLKLGDRPEPNMLG